MENVASFDERDLRRAFGRFATGVCVITAATGDRPVGLTANSFSTVSLRPPLVLWCLGAAASARPAFEAAGYFAINVLRWDQQDMSRQFSSKSLDRFAGTDWQSGRGGAPLLPAAIARFECRKAATYAEGDHLVFIGAVERFSCTDGDPLLFAAGRYAIPAAIPDWGAQSRPRDTIDEPIF